MRILPLGRIIAITVMVAPLLLVAPVAYAGYVPIVPIPGVDYDDFDMEAYLKVLYIIAISVAALLATGKLMLAGFQYLGSGASAGNKESAKKHLWGAIVGLLIVLLAVTILRTINPDLTGLPALPDAPTIEHYPFQPRTETVRPGEDSARDVQDQLEQCEALILYNDNTRCCNDGNSCDPPPPASPNLTGLDPNKNVYTAQEIIDIVEENGGEERVVDLGPGAQPMSDDQIRQMCELAAESRGKTLEEVVVMNQLVVSGGIRNVLQRPLCIMGESGGIQSEMMACDIADPDPNMTLQDYCGNQVSGCEARPGFQSWTEFFDPARIECTYEG